MEHATTVPAAGTTPPTSPPAGATPRRSSVVFEANGTRGMGARGSGLHARDKEG